MVISLLALFASGLAVQFVSAGATTWTGPPAAKIQVTARGGVDRRLVAQHVEEIKKALAVILAARPRLDEETGEIMEEITVEVLREALRGDAETSISASVTLAAVAGAAMAG
tara:strand:+ start:147 stop:482 length:336 start_codon:yes stop_codon:yes gene_type:complete